MPLVPSMIGRTGRPAVETIDPRWVMNYAASVGDANPIYFDTLASDPIPAHPAYLSQLEWAAIGNVHDELTEIDPEERLRGVHSFNDTTIHRPVHAGDTVSCVAQVVGLESGRSGAKLSIQLITTMSDGTPVSTSITTSVYRGSELKGEPAAPPRGPVAAEAWDVANTRTERIDISAIAAHVFSECARDYSPIHTDIAVATAAGLPGLIMHGTGTFALALSSLVNHEGGGDPRSVRQFSARLGAMVLCPSVTTLNVTPSSTDEGTFRFELMTDGGGRALADGLLTLHS